MAYNKTVSDEYNTVFDNDREAINFFIHSEAQGASRALGDITGLRGSMTHQGIG